MSLNRREILVAGAGAVGACLLPSMASAQKALPTLWKFCLNTSTIRGQKLTIEEEVKIAAKAGYNGIEPWIGELRTFKDKGGDFKDLAKLISDSQRQGGRLQGLGETHFRFGPQCRKWNRFCSMDCGRRRCTKKSSR